MRNVRNVRNVRTEILKKIQKKPGVGRTVKAVLPFFSFADTLPAWGRLPKGGYPMRHFLRDVLAAWLAAVLAAVAVHFMNL